MRSALIFLLISMVYILLPSEPLFCKVNKSEIRAEEIINKVFQSADNIKTLKFTFICNERIEGRMQAARSYIKLQTSPRKLYLNCKDAEVLWWEGKNNNLAYVHPYGFPYFNVNLDPNGSHMRKGQHHSILETGFDYFINILKVNAKEKAEGKKRFNINIVEEIINNRACYKLTAVNPDFTFIDYKVQKNEDIISIARKLNVSEYLILENNPKYSFYTSVDEGDIIKVPNAYSKTTVLYIDKELFLPVISRMYDNKGLFESYEYNSLEVNPIFKEGEFTKEWKEYKF